MGLLNMEECARTRGVWVPLLTNLGRVAPLAGALVPHGLLDAVHFLLVAALVLHGALLGLLQCALQGLNSLSRSPKSFFQFRKLTTQICIVTYQLWGEPGSEVPEMAVQAGERKQKSPIREGGRHVSSKGLIPFTHLLLWKVLSFLLQQTGLRH